MIAIPTIAEFTLIGVAKRGVPNEERLVLRPNERINLGQFGVLVARLQEDGSAVPLLNAFFWFGDIAVEPPSWIYVYTGPGTFSQSRISATKQPAYAFHWGSKQTVFHDPAMIPLLIRLGGIGFGGFGETEAPLTEAELDALRRWLFSDIAALTDGSGAAAKADAGKPSPDTDPSSLRRALLAASQRSKPPGNP